MFFVLRLLDDGFGAWVGLIVWVSGLSRGTRMVWLDMLLMGGFSVVYICVLGWLFMLWLLDDGYGCVGGYECSGFAVVEADSYGLP